MKSKIALPSAIAGPLFAVLVGMRRVRGTPFDPFGRTEVRRAERRLAREFEASILELASVLDRTNYALAVELARLPDLVRGYEGIKLANIARYDERRADLLGALRSAGTQRAMSSREGG